MYEMHGSRVSTRYRDLYDLGLIALELQVDQELLHMAILEQRNAREVSLPVELELPGPDWSRSYPKFVSTLHHKRAELESVEKP